MRIYLIAGETSGDQHAADVVRELRKQLPQCRVRGMAGDRCAAQGMELWRHFKQLSFMGFWEVIRHLRTIRRALDAIKQDILEFKPDRILLVDYPGFNLRIAKFAHKHDIPVHYYIAPKVWAWKESRISTIRSYVQKVYCILPFEESYFRKHGIDAQYIGNPSKIQIERSNQGEESSQGQERSAIALLPGSRHQEISANLGIMVRAATHFPHLRPVVAQAPGFDADYYRSMVPDLELETDMHQLLRRSKVAVVTSGTATLETALHRVPQVVCYRTSWLTYQLAKRFIRIPYISLVNIILGKAVLTELIQQDFTVTRIKEELDRLLQYPDALGSDYDALEDLLGTNDPATSLVQDLIQ